MTDIANQRMNRSCPRDTIGLQYDFPSRMDATRDMIFMGGLVAHPTYLGHIGGTFSSRGGFPDPSVPPPLDEDFPCRLWVAPLPAWKVLLQRRVERNSREYLDPPWKISQGCTLSGRSILEDRDTSREVVLFLQGLANDGRYRNTEPIVPHDSLAGFVAEPNLFRSRGIE